MSSATAVLTRPGVPRVNLIPRSEIERRERAAVTSGWVWGVFATVLVAVALIAGAFALNWIADQRLAAANARTATLLTELASLSEVSGALGTESELTQFRIDALGNDLAWAPVVAQLGAALPAEVEITGFDLVTGGVPQTADPTTEIGLTGTLTLTSPTAIDIAQTIRGIRALAPVADADGRLVATSQQTAGQYTYELSVSFDQTIYSGEFAPIAEEAE
ncbi:hypothetical protein [Microbacterium hominis]|uniref:PilN domain-containing protein n=1 Tax=Microbacterium hominis TaxID=162426 RepID=A0A7D4Q8A7_9MICO|nr:hypothetical protein [Microbacterium hominis]QKJ19699.1 hypothetical protein HQM25_10205 [Microbacterium hominis]